MKVQAKLNNLRISPRKARIVASIIKGLDVDDALTQLEHTLKSSSLSIKKLLSSAIGNAENNFGLDRSNLYVYDIQVGEGMKLKRWLPRAYGRATLILKRASNISLALEERVEGKNRKTKEQMEKIKKEREEAKKKIEKEMREERAASAKSSADMKAVKAKEDKAEEVFKEKKEEAQKKGGKRGWMKKMFQRKSG